MRARDAIALCRVTDEIGTGTEGRWTVDRFEITEDAAALFNMQMAMRPGGRGVTPGRFTRLLRKGAWDPIMSDTPAELRDMLDLFIHVIKAEPKTAVVNGLGMGCAVKGLLACGVEQVDVVELDSDVAALMERVAPWVSDPRVTVHLGDAHEYKWPVGKTWDIAWRDIWDAISSDNLDSYARLNRRYGRRVGKQFAWAQELARSRIW